MSGLLQATWYQRFRGEMQAIGCKFTRNASMLDDEDIEVPLEKMAEARKIILKYSDRAVRSIDDTVPYRKGNSS